MSHTRIPIEISETTKVALRDYLVTKKYIGGWDDWVYDKLKEIAINAKIMLVTGSTTTLDKRKVAFTEDDINKVIIRHDEAFKGDATLTVGDVLNEGLCNSYKIQKFVNEKLENKDKITSFEQYINEVIKSNFNVILLQSYSDSLTKEIKEIKEPDTPKTDKKQ